MDSGASDSFIGRESHRIASLKRDCAEHSTNWGVAEGRVLYAPERRDISVRLCGVHLRACALYWICLQALTHPWLSAHSSILGR